MIYLTIQDGTSAVANNRGLSEASMKESTYNRIVAPAEPVPLKRKTTRLPSSNSNRNPLKYFVYALRIISARLGRNLDDYYSTRHAKDIQKSSK